jgi:hypothetical protein
MWKGSHSTIKEIFPRGRKPAAAAGKVSRNIAKGKVNENFAKPKTQRGPTIDTWFKSWLEDTQTPRRTGDNYWHEFCAATELEAGSRPARLVLTRQLAPRRLWTARASAARPPTRGSRTGSSPSAWPQDHPGQGTR